jgi:hypothetical protein
MTQSPSAGGWESSAERQIRAAIERGEFDNLPGSGQPIPDLDRQYDELWWLRKKLSDEGFSIEPPALVLRRDVADVRERIGVAATEDEVRRLVAAVNRRIADLNAHATDGPSSDVMPLSVEQVLSDWRRARGRPG